MKRKEAIQHFSETYAAVACYNSLETLDKYYHANWQQLTHDFNHAFTKLCSKISQAQAQGCKGKIAYIYCSFLYSSLQEGRGRYRMDAYDKDWFFDKTECAASYDAQWAYSFLHELCNRLNQERKKYAGRITVYDVDFLKRTEAVKYGAYVEALTRQAVKRAVQSPEFAAVAKEDVLTIFTGEYKDQAWLVYRYDSRAKDISVIKDQLAVNKRYSHEVWENLDFSNTNLAEIDLRYARLTGSILVHTDLNSTLLWGVDFTNTKITDTDFSYSEMPGADFGHTQITDSRFYRIDGERYGLDREPYIGTIPGAGFQQAILKKVDFEEAILNHANFHGTNLSNCNFNCAELVGVCFQGATITDCDFGLADLREVNFRDAVLTNCDLSFADLEGAIFPAGTDLDKLGLTKEQKQAVTFA